MIFKSEHYILSDHRESLNITLLGAKNNLFYYEGNEEDAVKVLENKTITSLNIVPVNDCIDLLDFWKKNLVIENNTNLEILEKHIKKTMDKIKR